MPEVLHTEVVGARTLGAPSPTWDPATRAALDHELSAAEARGHAAGHAAGRAEATAQLQATVTAVTQAVTALHAEVAAQRETAIAGDLDRVAAVVAAVLGASPPPTTEVLAGRIRAAVERLDDPTLPVRLHPDDLAVLAPLLDDPRVTLTADPSLSRGEARVEGTWGRADLTRVAVTRAALDILATGGDLTEGDA